jgi:hypothetical protein
MDGKDTVLRKQMARQFYPQMKIIDRLGIQKKEPNNNT